MKLCISCQLGKPIGKFVNCYLDEKVFLVRNLALANSCQFFKKKTEAKWKRKNQNEQIQKKSN